MPNHFDTRFPCRICNESWKYFQRVERQTTNSAASSPSSRRSEIRHETCLNNMQNAPEMGLPTGRPVSTKPRAREPCRQPRALKTFTTGWPVASADGSGIGNLVPDALLSAGQKREARHSRTGSQPLKRHFRWRREEYRSDRCLPPEEWPP